MLYRRFIWFITRVPIYSRKNKTCLLPLALLLVLRTGNNSDGCIFTTYGIALYCGDTCIKVASLTLGFGCNMTAKRYSIDKWKIAKCSWDQLNFFSFCMIVSWNKSFEETVYIVKWLFKMYSFLASTVTYSFQVVRKQLLTDDINKMGEGCSSAVVSENVGHELLNLGAGQIKLVSSSVMTYRSWSLRDLWAKLHWIAENTSLVCWLPQECKLNYNPKPIN